MARRLPLCPVERALLMIGDKWKMLVLRDLMAGPRRFGELMRMLTGVSQKMLTQQLRAMEADGLIRREVFAEVPPRVEYSLTELGLSLRPILDALMTWGEQYQRLQGGQADTQEV